MKSDPRPVVILHGREPRSTNVAGRIAGHLRAGGLHAVRAEAGDRHDGRLLDARGTVVVYASGVWWSDELAAELVSLRPARRTAVVRCDTSRLPDALHGLPFLSLIPGRSYQPTPDEGGGYEHLFTILAPELPRPPKRPTAVFLSYSSDNSAFLDQTLVPLLDDHGISYFDFQYTEKLDTANLDPELERWVAASAVMLTVATPEWQKSAWCPKELVFARQGGKPVVAVWPPRVGSRHAANCGDNVRVVSFGRDVKAAGLRLVKALDRHLPS